MDRGRCTGRCVSTPEIMPLCRWNREEEEEEEEGGETSSLVISPERKGFSLFSPRGKAVVSRTGGRTVLLGREEEPRPHFSSPPSPSMRDNDDLSRDTAQSLGWIKAGRYRSS